MQTVIIRRMYSCINAIYRYFKSKVIIVIKKLFHNDKNEVINIILIKIFMFFIPEHQHTEMKINKLKRIDKFTELKIF